MSNIFSLIIKKPLINSILRFVNATSMSHVSWMNSLCPESSIASLASTCNSPAHRYISIAPENSESQSASPRLNQKLLKQKYYFYVSFLTGLILFCLQTNISAADSVEKILINADHMRLNIESGHSVYTGNVRISQGKLVLSGDKVTLEQNNNEIERITVTGKPARYKNVTEKGEPIQAEAEHMVYSARRNKLEMTVNARLQQPGHQFSSQKIIYDTLKKTIIAGGNNAPSNKKAPETNTDSKQKQRVNITLTPKKQLKQTEESTTE